MSTKQYAKLGIEALIVVIVLALFLGQLLGQPILLSYVFTGSMAPTMDPGDGFVAVPSALVTEYSEGDVITFEAEEIQGGGLTTHRIVGETEQGYVTRGDANPFTDQDGGEPHVQEAQIVAKAGTVGSTVIVVPHLGTVVMGLQDAIETVQQQAAMLFGFQSLQGTQGLAYLLFGLSVLAYIFETMREGGKSRERGRSRTRENGTDTTLILVVLAAVLMISATAAMVVPAGTEQFGVVSSQSASENPTVIQQGTTENLTYIVPNGGLVPTVVFLESETDGIEAAPDELYLEGQSSLNATVSITAPPETGYYRYFLTEHRYLAILPPSLIADLHGIHPWVPLGVINGLLGGGIYLIGRVVIGTDRVRIRSRDRPSSSFVSRLFE
ncbi:signal peptidase I [Natronocalculus amylovorans]|uniref:Signal peptidase I n=1 Tax=Natronocalculus amylovorans TaxID=2917812 RepID=A0AAE3KAQ6_9EURY|nr:signal peptidase I [Natronocalculus amylovorans]MCL9816989.1 signal peptidase I [Natronocalculus amylovorans]